MNNNESAANNASSSLQNGFNRNHPEQMVQNFGFGDIDDVALAGGHDIFHQLITAGFGTLPVGDMIEQEPFFDNRNVFSADDMLPRNNVVARGPPNNRRQREPGRERHQHFLDNRVRNNDNNTQRCDLENDELMAALLACEEDGDIAGGEYDGFKEPLPGINHANDDYNFHIEDDQGEGELNTYYYYY